MKLEYVFCGGMIRSGSTLQYNIVSELLERVCGGRRTTWVDASDHAEFFRHDRVEPTSFKAHQLVPEIRLQLATNRSRGVSCFRDIRDVIASSLIKFRLVNEQASILRHARQAIDDFAAWEACPGVLVSRYEDMVADVRAEVARIAGHLQLQCADELLETIARRCEGLEAGLGPSLTSGAYTFDPHTLLHTDHFNGGTIGRYRSELDPRVVDALEAEFGTWLAGHGYAFGEGGA